MSTSREPGQHLAIVGPTASGKTDLAVELALRRASKGELVEIVSIDSMAVYRGMDIGTTTPDAATRARVAHHAIDLVDPDVDFSVVEHRAAANAAIDDIEARGGRALLVGGTGLYVQAIVDDLELPGRYPATVAELEAENDTRALHDRLVALDPEAADRIEPDNRRRVLRALEVTLGSGRPFSSYGPGLAAYPPTPFVLAGVRVPREDLTARIAARFDRQLADGFLDEVATLERSPRSRTASQALGYRELAAHLRGECSLDDARARAVERTRQFAVRQLRWFGRDPRIVWFDRPAADDDGTSTLVDGLDELWSERSAAAPKPEPGTP